MQNVQSGVIKNGGSPAAQVTLIDSESGVRVSQLYTKDGVFLAQCPFEGEDDQGYAIGLALYQGYCAGQNNRELEIRKAVEAAFRERGTMML